MSKLFVKTSISRNHAYRVLHSRFPPFGFVLKPVWSVHMFFHMIMADSCQSLRRLALLGEGESSLQVSPRGSL